jgi:hypothetical protein
MGESHEFQVHDATQEKAALTDGCHELLSQPLSTAGPPAEWPIYPKTTVHPGYPNGGATGLLVKDYRGKNAEQPICKFYGGLEARIADDLKQAAIEEGWNDERDQAPAAPWASRPLARFEPGAAGSVGTGAVGVEEPLAGSRPRPVPRACAAPSLFGWIMTGGASLSSVSCACSASGVWCARSVLTYSEPKADGARWSVSAVLMISFVTRSAVAGASRIPLR